MNYRLKPVKEESLYLCLDEVARNLEGRYYIFRNKQEIVQIPFHDILVFSSSFHYVDIMTTGETYCQYSSLNTIIEHLPREFVYTDTPLLYCEYGAYQQAVESQNHTAQQNERSHWTYLYQ